MTTIVPACLPGGAQIAVVPGLNYELITALWQKPDAFVSMCKIQVENEGIDYLTPTPAQREVIKAYHDHRWNMVVKYRQAKITTISVMLMLRDCMYLEGVKGLLVAEKQDTAEDVFERILLAYKHLPESVKMPLQVGRKGGVRSIHFIHGGNIKIITAGSKSPAVGRSIDRLVITEFGEAQWQRNAAMQIFPTVSKRANARIILESTTGRAGSHFETMWRLALEGKGRFNPVFLRWWLDKTAAAEPGSQTFTPDEVKLLDTLPGATRRQLAFRRLALDTEFAGDPRLFSAKYPSNRYDGWLGSLNPVLPAELIKAMLDRTDPEVGMGDHGCHEIEAPNTSGYYVITADPAGYGDEGDNSALTVWDAVRNVEVGFWEGREDPGLFARRLLRVQKRYQVLLVEEASTESIGPPASLLPDMPPRLSRVLVVVESNAMGCIAALKELKAKHLYHTKRSHPGWIATENSIMVGEARLVKMIRSGEIEIRSRGTLHQLLDYDGSRKKRRKKTNGETQHFDRARTVVMFADVACRRTFRKQMTEVTGKVYDNDRSKGVPISHIDKITKGSNAANMSCYGPPPSDWM